MVTRLFNFIRDHLKKPSSGSASPDHSRFPQENRDASPDSARPKRRRSSRKRKTPATGRIEQTPIQYKHSDWDPALFTVTPEEGKTRFHDFALPAELMHAIADLGFQFCTPIQAESLPHTMKGLDAIGKAQTGTGKTAAFLITMMTDMLKSRENGARPPGSPQGLVIAPTRELVIQIAKDAEDLAKYSDITVVAVYGGIDYMKQQAKIADRQIDLVVATPGRLLDFHRNKVVDLSKVKTMVIDEADRMLDMGFIPDVRKIVNATPPKDRRQTLMFSATITPEVKHLASQWTSQPVNIEIEPTQVTVDTVTQVVYLTTAKEKYNLLYNTIIKNNLERVIVFTNRRDETRRLTERLKRNGISCAMLSGEVAQGKRIKTLEDFKAGRIRVLVATDVAGRGIHIEGISHVINYTLPYESEDYVHRIGRTARAGAFGTSISFACEEGAFYIPEIEAYIGAKLPCTTPDPELLEEPPKGTFKPEKEAFLKTTPERSRRSRSGGPRQQPRRTGHGGKS